MLSGLPKKVDLYRMAVAGESHAGQLRQSAFPRLAAAHSEVERWVDISLRFGREQGVHYLRGNLKTELSVVCQRCMNPMDLAVDTSFALGFVRNREEERCLPEGFEPLWVERSEMDLLAIVEDELLLGLPMVVLHPPAQCPSWVDPLQMQTGERAESDGSTPFSVLAALTQDRD